MSIYQKAITALESGEPTTDAETLAQLDAHSNELQEDIELAQEMLDKICDFEIECFKSMKPEKKP